MLSRPTAPGKLKLAMKDQKQKAAPEETDAAFEFYPWR